MTLELCKPTERYRGRGPGGPHIAGINVTLFRLHVHSLLDLWFADWLHRPATASETREISGIEATWDEAWSHMSLKEVVGKLIRNPEISVQFLTFNSSFFRRFLFFRDSKFQGQLPSTLWGRFMGPSRLTDADPDGRSGGRCRGCTKTSTMAEL